MYSVSKILLIMPVICGGISNINIDSISIKINKNLRLIFNVKLHENKIPKVSTNENNKELKLLKFIEIYHFHLLKFLHFLFW